MESSGKVIIGTMGKCLDEECSVQERKGSFSHKATKKALKHNGNRTDWEIARAATKRPIAK